MDILPLLNELQGIARDGLTFTKDPYDRKRYERLMELVSNSYGTVLDMPPTDVRKRLSTELDIVTPKVGAVAGIFDEEGKILLMQRSDDERWCLPCGWVELNETPAEAAMRETAEETGLIVQIDSLVDVFTRYPSGEYCLYTTVSVVYYCEATGGELGLSGEGISLRYWSYDQVHDWHADHSKFAQAAYLHWQKRKSA